MLKAKAFGLASLLFCGSIGGLAGEKQTDPADFAPFTVEVTRGGPIGVCTLTNPPMGKGVKFIVKPKEGEGSFKNGKGKILSSKSHGKNVWVAVEDSATCFVTALKSLGTEKSTLVLCGGEWANRGNGGDGNNGRALDDTWLAELSGQEELRLFICHQYYDEPDFNLKCRKSAMEMCSKYPLERTIVLFVGIRPREASGSHHGHINNIGHGHNDENGEKCGCPDDKSCIRVGGNIGAFLETIIGDEKLSEVYSFGHGGEPSRSSPSCLFLATSSPTQEEDKLTIGQTDDDVSGDFEKFNSCSITEYIGSFRKYLKNNANIFLMHCYTGDSKGSGSIVNKTKEILPNCIIIGVEGMIEFSVNSKIKITGNNGNVLSPLEMIAQNQDNYDLIVGDFCTPAENARFIWK